jgi:hypothetical protein
MRFVIAAVQLLFATSRVRPAIACAVTDYFGLC